MRFILRRFDVETGIGGGPDFICGDLFGVLKPLQYLLKDSLTECSVSIAFSENPAVFHHGSVFSYHHCRVRIIITICECRVDRTSGIVELHD